MDFQSFLSLSCSWELTYFIHNAPKVSHSLPGWLLLLESLLSGKFFPFHCLLPLLKASLNTVLSDFMEVSFPCSRSLLYFLKLNSSSSINVKTKIIQTTFRHRTTYQPAPSAGFSSQHAFLVVTLCSLHPSGISIFQSTEFSPPKSINSKPYGIKHFLL